MNSSVSRITPSQTLLKRFSSGAKSEGGRTDAEALRGLVEVVLEVLVFGAVQRDGLALVRLLDGDAALLLGLALRQDDHVELRPPDHRT